MGHNVAVAILIVRHFVALAPYLIWLVFFQWER